MLKEKYALRCFCFMNLMLMGLAVILPASTVEIDGHDYIVTAWGIEDGLPRNSVLCMIRTSDGYMWLGTQSGLVRFDGMAIRVYNRWNTKELRSDRVLCLYEDNAGTLWIGTDGGGISGLKLKQGEWTLLTMQEGLSNNTVRTIASGGPDHLWLGTDNGLNHLDIAKRTIKSYTVEDGLSGYSITALTTGNPGSSDLWIGTNGSGINLLRNGKFQSVPSCESLSGREITVLHLDRQGSILVGTDMGLYRYRGDEIQPLGTESPLWGSAIKAILEDSSGNIWFGTEGEGLYRFRQEQGIRGTFMAWGTHQGLPDDFIYSLWEDREGNLWLGTFTTGVVRLKPARVRTITNADGLPEDAIKTIFRDDAGFLWVGTQRKGLVKMRIEGNTVHTLQTFTGKDGLPSDRVRALYQDRDKNLWIGTWGGLVKKEPGKSREYTIKDGLSTNDITAILQGRSGTLWVGTSAGLNFLAGEKFTLFSSNPGPPVNINIRILAEDRRGNLLVGTNAGIYRLEDGKLKEFAPGYDVLALHEDSSGDLWVGTNGSGILFYRQGNPADFFAFSQANGLPANDIFSLVEDRSGNLWMSSYQGVIRVAKKELAEYAAAGNRTGLFITAASFDEKEGMMSRECVMGGQPSARLVPGEKQGTGDGEAESDQSKLYIPTVKGIAVIPLHPPHPLLSTVKPQPPAVIIENVIADNRSIVHPPALPHLPTGSQVLEFYFTAIDFSAPEKVRILYKLDGFDTRWQEAMPKQNRMALYLNLPPGEYCFNVIAAGNEGVWNSQGDRYAFIINAPFYKRPVFYGMIFLGLVILLGGIYWFFYRQKKVDIGKEEEEQKKEKYKTSALLPETTTQVLPRLNRLMEKEKVFLEPDINLKKLSARLHVHYNHLSQIINEQLGKSFNDYINSYRIEEAKKMLADPDRDKKTILEIAYDTGFYSKSVFNTAFKKFTGQTPSQYKKSMSTT